MPSAPCCNGKVFCRENGKLKYPRSPGNAPLLSTPDYVGVLELGWKGECKRRGLDKFRFSDPGEASLQVGLWAAATRVSDSQCNLARLGCHVVFISCYNVNLKGLLLLLLYAGLARMAVLLDGLFQPT